jgi:hypothetical protein
MKFELLKKKQENVLLLCGTPLRNSEVNAVWVYFRNYRLLFLSGYEELCSRDLQSNFRKGNAVYL